MNQRAQKIWETFCKELIGEPTEDQAHALAAALRMISNEFGYYLCADYEEEDDMIIESRNLYNLADELEK